MSSRQDLNFESLLKAVEFAVVNDRDQISATATKGQTSPTRPYVRNVSGISPRCPTPVQMPAALPQASSLIKAATSCRWCDALQKPCGTSDCGFLKLSVITYNSSSNFNAVATISASAPNSAPHSSASSCTSCSTASCSCSSLSSSGFASTEGFQKRRKRKRNEEAKQQHKLAERERRANLREGMQRIQQLLPHKDGWTSQTMLRFAMNYIEHLEQQKRTFELERELITHDTSQLQARIAMLVKKFTQRGIQPPGPVRPPVIIPTAQASGFYSIPPRICKSLPELEPIEALNRLSIRTSIGSFTSGTSAQGHNSIVLGGSGPLKRQDSNSSASTVSLVDVDSECGEDGNGMNNDQSSDDSRSSVCSAVRKKAAKSESGQRKFTTGAEICAELKEKEKEKEKDTGFSSSCT